MNAGAKVNIAHLWWVHILLSSCTAAARFKVRVELYKSPPLRRVRAESAN